MILDGRIDLHAGVEDGHFLDRPHDAHRVLVPAALEFLVGAAPARAPGGRRWLKRYGRAMNSLASMPPPRIP